jgi:hypothetical protein
MRLLPFLVLAGCEGGADPTHAPDGAKLELEYGAPGPGETMALTAILDGINACP